MDTISWRGHLWLVPKWQRAKTEGIRQPARIVRPRLFQFVRPKVPQHGEDYILTAAIPKAVLDGQQVSSDIVEFEVVEAPNFEAPIPTLQ